MIVKGKIDNNVYTKLINYAFSKCNIISLTKYYNQNNQLSENIANYIMSLENYNKNEIMNKYSEQLLEELNMKYMNDSKIFNDAYKTKYETNLYKIGYETFEKIKVDNRKKYIEESIQWFVYYSMTSNWIKENQNIILKTQNKTLNNSIKHSTIYYIKLTDKLKNEILSKRTLFDWQWPISLEDISFYCEDCCWIHTITHEKLCEIFCENETEYEYLKSIGINFLDEKI